MSDAGRRSLYRNGDFMLLWSRQVVSAIGSRVSMIAFPLLVLSLTRSPAQAGIVGFAATLPYLLFQLPAGGLVDRLDRKRTMIACDVGRALALASIPIALWVGHLTTSQISVVAFVDGTLFIGFSLAEGAALPNVVAPEALPAAIAQNEAKTRAAQLLGQPIGGILFEAARSLPFVADAVSYVVSVLTLLFIKAEFQGQRTEERRSFAREIGEGFGWLWRQRFLRACALLIGATNFMFQAMVLVIIVLARSRGASAGLIGVTFGFVGVGGLVGSFVGAWVQRHVPTKVVVLGVAWFWAALLPLFAIVPWPIAYGPILGLMALVGPPWSVVLGTYELRLTPDRLLGRVQSVEGLLAWGSIPLGSLGAGFLLQTAGATTMTWLMVVMTGVVALAATLSRSMREVPELPNPADTDVAAR